MGRLVLGLLDRATSGVAGGPAGGVPGGVNGVHGCGLPDRDLAVGRRGDVAVGCGALDGVARSGLTSGGSINGGVAGCGLSNIGVSGP